MPTPAFDSPPADARAALRTHASADPRSPEVAALRLAVLRQTTPAAIVQIDPVRQDDTAIAVKATIGLPGGARHTAIAAHDVHTESSWATQYAQTEATAISRALDGLGLTLAQQLGDADRIVPPVDRPAPEVPAVDRPPASGPDAANDHLPEYSWNAFWREVRGRGLTREDVERALGRSIQEASPQEAIAALRASGIDI